MDPNPQLPWGIQQAQPGSLKTISQTKLATFAVGQQKKSRFQKAREEAEEKKKKEEEEAAKIYGQFVASFGGNEEEYGKTFVRGGQYNNPSAGAGSESQGSINTDRLYHMNSKPIYSKDNPAGSKAAGKEMAKMLDEMKERDMQRSIRNPNVRSESNFPNSTNKQNLNDFFEDLNPSNPSQSNTRDNEEIEDDIATTNLYLSNLSPLVTEELLCEIFGKFGEINSIKIMWPRSDEDRNRKKNCGFVSFKKRTDASDALTELNDSLLYDNRMSVGWGKSVKIYSTPFVLPHTHKAQSASAIANEVKVFFSQFEFTKADRGRPSDSRRIDRWDNNSRVPSEGRMSSDSFTRNDYHRQKRRERSRSRSRERYRERSPSPRGDLRKRARSRSRSNSSDRLRDPIYDQLAKDRDRKKTAESIAGLTGAQIERARAAMRGGKEQRLDDNSYDEFKDILDRLTIERESIKLAMGFAFDHIDAHQEVVELIRDSLLSHSAPPPLLVARMYLLSDLLHNSGTTTIKNATHYRSSIQATLPEIFFSFQEYLPSLSGRFTTKQFTDRINSLLVIWSDWAIFPTAFLNGLETMLNLPENELSSFTSYTPESSELEEDLYTLKRHAKFHGISSNIDIYVPKFSPSGSKNEENLSEMDEKVILCRLLHCIKHYVKVKENPIVLDNASHVNAVEEEELDGVPVDMPEDISAAPVENEIIDITQLGKRDGWVEVTSTEDIDGVPLDDDVDGVPLDDIDGIPLQNADDDIDGEPIDDDIDGVPLDE